MKKTLLMLALCAACLNAGAEPVQYWLNGVSTEGGWKDVNKVMDKSIDGDSALCWAAAASNIIAWWQEQNASELVGRGNDIPQGEQNIFNAFNDGFYNKGFDSYWGLRWFMDGGPELYEPIIESYSPADIYMDPASSNHGGYYNDIVVDVASSMESYSQFETDDSGFLVMDVIPLEVFTQELVSCMSRGYGVTLGLEASYGGHAITLWGMEMDEDGYIAKMWVTDSDDAPNPKVDVDGLIPLELTRVRKEKSTVNSGLQEYYVYEIRDLLGEGGGVWYHGNDEYIDSFAALNPKVAFMPRSVPEPCTGTLSLLALAGLCARRRRK